jgi:hypothetical protein
MPAKHIVIAVNVESGMSSRYSGDYEEIEFEKVKKYLEQGYTVKYINTIIPDNGSIAYAILFTLEKYE